MIGSIGAQLALLAFSTAILAGIWVGNSPATILLRGLVVMFVALMIGQTAAWTSKAVLADHLRRRKRDIDLAHAREIEALAAEKVESEGGGAS